MADSHRIPVSVLRQLIRLDPNTGNLYWLPRGPEWFTDGAHSATHACARWNSRYAGALAGSSSNGYRQVMILKVAIMAHIVVFALRHGRWPDGIIDHHDGEPSNNVPNNLREATQRQNLQNVGSKGGTSRFCGVDWRASRGKWRARCRDGTGFRHNLGHFMDEEDAARAYDAAARQFHGEFARLNFPDS